VTLTYNSLLHAGPHDRGVKLEWYDWKLDCITIVSTSVFLNLRLTSFVYDMILILYQAWSSPLHPETTEQEYSSHSVWETPFYWIFFVCVCVRACVLCVCVCVWACTCVVCMCVCVCERACVLCVCVCGYNSLQIKQCSCRGMKKHQWWQIAFKQNSAIMRSMMQLWDRSNLKIWFKLLRIFMRNIQYRSKVWTHLLIQWVFFIFLLFSTFWNNSEDIKIVNHEQRKCSTSQNIFYIWDDSK
jgi:hypothetical protein